MAALIIKYRLKPGVAPADFENWVRNVDQPAMRGLARVESFDTYRVEGPLMGDGEPSVQYIELFDVPDMEGFGSEDLPGATVQQVLGEFMGFADAPEFLRATRL